MYKNRFNHTVLIPEVSIQNMLGIRNIKIDDCGEFGLSECHRVTGRCWERFPQQFSKLMLTWYMISIVSPALFGNINCGTLGHLGTTCDVCYDGMLTIHQFSEFAKQHNFGGPARPAIFGDPSGFC